MVPTMVVDESEFIEEKFFYILLITVNISIALVTMLAACLCCKRNLPKNDMMGLEGMVKLKNPDDIIIVTTVNHSVSHLELNASTICQGDTEKRASTAAHRSLPDIPAAETNGDTGSELYETVADKMLMENLNQTKSPTVSLKKLASISQHSSISQADDVSSPYSRVKNSPHDYAKVGSTEHPYAQLNAPSTSQNNNLAMHGCADDIDGKAGQSTFSEIHNRSSQHSDNSQNIIESAAPAEIPAASAIAGMISASQDLPYMTPPLSNQHFSGDSQDSSKGYTSISVREPLANILAQQTTQQPRLRMVAAHARNVNDPHYATVSDDSDETYAAIEDPNIRQSAQASTEIYTSGSETYAQIQPMQSLNSIVISVEINNVSTSTLVPSSNGSLAVEHNNYVTPAHHMTHAHTIGALKSSLDYNQTPVPPPVDSLRAQMHSRQASSSSNNSSSLCNLGSPKPEKRQANSPLPPTPKSNISTITTNNLLTGRNSVISVMECSAANSSNMHEFAEIELREKSQYCEVMQQQNKNLSPSKDIEGMYAKVMKKNKLSRNSPPSQSSSPILNRKSNERVNANLGVSPLDSMAADLLENKSNSQLHSSKDRNRLRSNSYGATKDHGYETIPGDAVRNIASTTTTVENRRSDGYTQLLQKEHQRSTFNATATILPIAVYNLQLPQELQQKQCDNDKHYEIIATSGVTTAGHSTNNDPGYETVTNHEDVKNVKNKSSDYDPNYEVLLGLNMTDNTFAGISGEDDCMRAFNNEQRNSDEDSTDGYSKVRGMAETNDLFSSSIMAAIMGTDNNHNYASILETKRETSTKPDSDSDHYARIGESAPSPAPKLTVDEALTPRIADISITSPTSLASSSLLNSGSVKSSGNVNSSSTVSSCQMSTSCSQYESLTGSETDPNYESVCYLNTSSGENPYERLTDLSDTQLSNSSPQISPTEISAASSQPTNHSMLLPVDVEHSKTLPSNGRVIDTVKAANETSVDILVNDYFHV